MRRWIHANSWFLWAAMFGIAACGAHAVPYVVVESGSNAGLRSTGPHFDVIADPARFEQAFRAIHANQLPAPVPPPVDFEQSLVLLAALEHQPTAGYHLSIKRVLQSRGTVRVHIQVERPNPNQLLATVVTRPYVMIRVPRNAFDTVQFIGERDEVLREVVLGE